MGKPYARQIGRAPPTTSEHADRLRAHVELGIDHVYCHNVGRNHDEFIGAFGADVLPQLRTLSAQSITRSG